MNWFFLNIINLKKLDIDNQTNLTSQMFKERLPIFFGVSSKNRLIK